MRKHDDFSDATHAEMAQALRAAHEEIEIYRTALALLSLNHGLVEADEAMAAGNAIRDRLIAQLTLGKRPNAPLRLRSSR